MKARSGKNILRNVNSIKIALKRSVFFHTYKMEAQGLNKTTQKYVYAVLRKALNYAVKRCIIPYNVINHMDCPIYDMSPKL